MEEEILKQILDELKKLNAKTEEMRKDTHHELRAMKVRLQEIKL